MLTWVSWELCTATYINLIIIGSSDICYTCNSVVDNEDVCTEISDKTPRVNNTQYPGCVKFEGEFCKYWKKL